MYIREYAIIVSSHHRRVCPVRRNLIAPLHFFTNLEKRNCKIEFGGWWSSRKINSISVVIIFFTLYFNYYLCWGILARNVKRLVLGLTTNYLKKTNGTCIFGHAECRSIIRLFLTLSQIHRQFFQFPLWSLIRKIKNSL